MKTAGLEADWLPVGQKWEEMGGNVSRWAVIPLNPVEYPKDVISIKETVRNFKKTHEWPK